MTMHPSPKTSPSTRAQCYVHRMRLFPKRLQLFAIAVISLLPVSLPAVTIAEYIGGTFESTSTDYRGQSFTTTAADAFAFNNIAINFFTRGFGGVTTPVGVRGLLFSMPVGTPSGVNSMAAGFLGSATTGGTFDPNMTLLSGTQYYFYVGLSNFFLFGVGYGGGTGYIASGGFPNQPFQGGSVSYNFRVTGSPVPDAGMTLWLFALGVFGLELICQRRPEKKPSVNRDSPCASS